MGPRRTQVCSSTHIEKYPLSRNIGHRAPFRRLSTTLWTPQEVSRSPTQAPRSSQAMPFAYNQRSCVQCHGEEHPIWDHSWSPWSHTKSFTMGCLPRNMAMHHFFKDNSSFILAGSPYWDSSLFQSRLNKLTLTQLPRRQTTNTH